MTGWLRGTVKAVPSGDTVLIVANAGPTVRASCIYIYICFGGRLYPSSSSSVAVVFLLSFAMCFLFCFGSLEIITGVSLVSESSSSFESSSFPDDDVFFLSLTTLLHTPVVLFFPLFHQSAGPPPEKIVTLAGIIAPRMVRERIFKSCRHSRASFFLLLRVLSVSLFARSAPKALLSSSSSSSERAKSFESLFSQGRGDATKARAGGFFCHSLSLSL